MIKTITKLYENLALRSRILQTFAKRYYNSMISNEIRLGAIHKHDRVLFIGGGPLPMSALMISERTQAHVEVVDCDFSAIQKAKWFVAKTPYKISFHHAKAETFDTKDYTVIIVAKQVIPQHCVLDNIFEKVDRGTRIICRFYKPDKKILMSSSKIAGNACLIVA